MIDTDGVAGAAMTGAVTGEAYSSGPRFPALDPEPPPAQRVRRRILVGVACVAIAAVVVGLSLVLSGSHVKGGPEVMPATIRLFGRVVVVDRLGNLATSRPDGTNVRVVPSVGKVQLTIVASADGKFLATRDGTVISLAGPVVSVEHTAINLERSQAVPMSEPFADHDRALVVLNVGRFGGPTATAGVEVVDLASGRQVPLGTADAASGDPAQVGAFVSAPASDTSTSTAGQVRTADSAVELRDAGAAAVRLISAAQAADVVGIDPSIPVALEPFPDAAGDKVAITVTMTNGNAPAGLVIVDRSGQIQGEVLASVGMVVQSLVSWSPDGSTLAYVTPSRNGSAVATWTVGGGSTVRPMPPGGPAPFGCLWSPDGTALVCPGSGDAQNKQEWYVMGAGPGPVAVVVAPWLPLAWIPDPPAGGGRT